MLHESFVHGMLGYWLLLVTTQVHVSFCGRCSLYRRARRQDVLPACWDL